MKKGVIVSLLILSVFILPLISASIVVPSTPSDCSDASIKATWDSVFKETSTGITIFSNTTQSGRCETFTAYKIQGEIAEVLYASNTLVSGSNYTLVIGLAGNFTDTYINILRNITSFQNNTYTNNTLVTYGKSRSYNLANSILDFTSYFKQNPDSWTTNASTDRTTYQYIESVLNSSGTITSLGSSSANYSLNSATYILTSNSQCTSNWAAVNTTCRNDETFVVWYNDTNSCSAPTNRPANTTGYCDYNQNGLAGNETQISKTNLALTGYINSSVINYSRNYTSPMLVELREGNVSRISFNYSFSSALNIGSISVEKQNSSSKFGYLIVRNLHINKDLIIDKLNSSSSSVCVKDMEITNISQISANCTGESERLIACPGNNSSFGCTITAEGKYLVTGLTNSAVKEMGISSVVTCTENWTCGGWSVCSNGQRTRSCTDNNLCGTNVNEPVSTETCVNPCSPSWLCQEWNPTTCPKNATQARSCSDTNACNVSTGKPAESRVCVYEKPKTGIIIIIALIVIVFLASIVIGIYYLTKKNNPTAPSYQNYNTYQGPAGGNSPTNV